MTMPEYETVDSPAHQSLLNRVTADSGLERATVIDLFDKGWSFRLETGEPMRWQAPMPEFIDMGEPVVRDE
jgi:hypothetical protein